MATAKKTQIVITANAAVAKKVMDELAQRTDAIKQKMAGLDVTTKQGQREFKKLEKELVSYNSAISQNVTNTERISKAMKNLSGTSLNELKRALSAAKSELGKMSANDKGLKQMQGNVKALQTQIDKLTGSVHKQGGAWNTALKNLTAYVGLFQAFNYIKSMLTGVIQKNFEYSGSLTDIRKVSGLASEDIKDLSENLAKIDTRTTTEGLARLAYEGAKLGVGKYGATGMAQFVAAADKINVAIGEEMGDKALPALLKMTEVMGLIPKMGLEKSIEATGSAMFKLSSTTTATSNDIVEFAKRCTGVARTAGITTDQLLAMGSAFSAQMASPEVAATAMSKFIVALQKNHNLIEKDLNIPDGTINNMYKAGNAMGAIVLILEKMKAKGNMNALGEIFKDVGGDGQRLISSMVTMAKNVDMLKDHLDTSTEAFREGTAVTQEYEMQQQSAIGILERANNLWTKAFVNPGGVDNVKALAQTWYDISKAITDNEVALGVLKGVLQIVIWSCQTLANLLPGLAAGLLFKGAAVAITAIGKSFVSVGSSVLIATIQTDGLRASWKKLNASMKANWISFVIGLLAELGVALYEVFKKTEDVADAQLNVNKYVEEGASSWEKERRKIDSYVAAISSANTSAKERERLIKNFNKEYKPYLDKLGLEVNSVNTLKGAYEQLNNELRKKMFYEIKQKAYDTELGKEQGNVGKATVNYSKYINSEKGSTWAAYDTAYLQGQYDKGLSAEQIYRHMVEDVYGKSGTWSGYNGDYVLQTGSVKDNALRSYIKSFVDAQKGYNDTKKVIDDALDNLIGDYDPFAKEDPGELSNDAPDKDAIRQQKQEERDRRKAWREELKQKQDEANAIMDDVRNFYERQINQKMEDAIALGMDKTEQDLFVEPVRKRMNEALEQVRLAIAGQKNTWEQFKQTMDKDLIEKTDATGVNLSKGLLDNIQGNNIDALRNLMAQLSKNLGIPMTSTTAQIFAKASKNEQSNLSLVAKQQEARRKVAQEHDYTGVVKQNMYDDFNTMGYANPNAVEVTDKAAFDKRKANIIAMYEKARKDISKIYEADVSTEDGRGLLMQILFGEDPDGMAARIKATLGNETSDWQAFYLKLLQYSDEYTEAMKKQYDVQKKIVDQKWATNKRNLAQQEAIRKMQNESNLFGKRTNLLSNLGLANLTADPEIELMKARMQAAEDYYAFVKANTQNMQLIREADDARQQAELNYANQMATAMKSRLSQMKELVQPIEDFGSAVGQALATMKDDADSANEAIKSALKSMLESWGKMALNDVNTQMWKAINDAGAKRGKAKAQPDIDAARKNADANAVQENLSDIGTAGNPAHVIVDNGISVDANGNPTTPNANGNGNAEGVTQSSAQPTEHPAAWQKRNPGKTMDDYNREVQGIAGQAGSAVADVATGNSSLADAGADIAMSGVNAALNANIGGGKKKSKKEDKERKKALKEEKKHQKELTKETKKGLKDREKANDKGVKKITDVTTEGNKEQSKNTEIAQNTIVNATDAALNATLTAKQKNNDATLQSDAQRTQGEVTFSIAGAMAKCFEFLGPIAGPIAAAVVMSTLMGLLQWALSSAMGGSSKKSSSSSTKNTKLVSGMLTYDSGNVQDLKPFVGDNGEVYWATEQDKPQSGVNLLTTPTATTINGQRSLVAENGPELVIGRETTKAMMMNNPSLLKALVNYDSNYSGRNAARRTFDEGNVGEAVGNLASGASATDALITNATASNAALLQAVNALLQRLNEPISAKIDMYGRGNLYDSMTKANQFMKGKM